MNVTCAGTSVTEKSKLLLRAIPTRRNALSPKFLQRRHVPPFPFNYSHETQWSHMVREGPHHKKKQPKCSIAKDRTRSEAEPGPCMGCTGAELAAFLCLLMKVCGPIKIHVDNNGIIEELRKVEKECI